MIRKYIGDKASIEARCDAAGKIWEGKLFEGGRVTKFSNASLAEVDDLAAKKGMRLVPPARRP
jgi:hypothetical protein